MIARDYFCILSLNIVLVFFLGKSYAMCLFNDMYLDSLWKEVIEVLLDSNSKRYL